MVLAQNYPAYSLEIIPNKVEGKVEDLIEALKAYVPIDETDLRRFRKFRADYRSYEKVPLKLKLTPDEASRLAAQLYRFKGVEINARTFREYPFGPLTAHFLGYIGRISDSDQKKLEEGNRSAAYRGTTHIGKSGLEDYYEEALHGAPGYEEVEKDAAGNIVRIIRSDPPKTGQTLRLSMDIRMQQEADRLMANRRGALVAIDPQTGGVLAFVSKPNFDPNVFIDGIDGDTWKALNEDWQRPLINRVTQGLYPPGSTFKPFMAMALLESGKLTQHSIVPAPGAGHQPRAAISGGIWLWRAHGHRFAERIQGCTAESGMEGQALGERHGKAEALESCRNGARQRGAGLQHLHTLADGARTGNAGQRRHGLPSAFG